ncbi:hypothetical protein BC629DRAFT_473086 [Irpex lacteus]|nr:hypothetical protein BC629DRAFT_473086 [Irpex lacteus]
MVDSGRSMTTFYIPAMSYRCPCKAFMTIRRLSVMTALILECSKNIFAPVFVHHSSLRHRLTLYGYSRSLCTLHLANSAMVQEKRRTQLYAHADLLHFFEMATIAYAAKSTMKLWLAARHVSKSDQQACMVSMMHLSFFSAAAHDCHDYSVGRGISAFITQATQQRTRTLAKRSSI